MQEGLRDLGAFLGAHASIWRSHSPESTPPWAGEFPAIRDHVAFVESTVTDCRDVAALDPTWMHGPPRAWRDWLATAGRLTTLSALPQTCVRMHASLSRGVRACKWEQVRRFAGVVTPLVDVRSRRPANVSNVQSKIVDVCGGKGHLGRSMAALTGLPVLVADWESRLCARAKELAHSAGLDHMAVYCVDVRTSEFAALLAPADIALALHACGDLHVAVLDHVRRAEVAVAAVAPCCFCRTESLPFRGLSIVALGAGLSLDYADLSFSTCSPRSTTQKSFRRFLQKQAWEFGFSAWFREATGDAWEVPQRRIGRRGVAGTFLDFCTVFARGSGVRPPSQTTATEYELLGWKQLQHATLLEYAREPFRRALEVWLLLDRATWLDEAGLAVEVGTFCPPEITPRNVAIVAHAG